MHLTFILVKITLLNARVTSVRAVCCVAKFFSISHKSGSQAEVRGEFIYPALKLYFLPFFWGTFFIEDKRRLSTKDKRSRPCCQSAGQSFHVSGIWILKYFLDSSLPFSSAGTYIVFWRLFTLSLINKNGTKIRVDVEKIET